MVTLHNIKNATIYDYFFKLTVMIQLFETVPIQDGLSTIFMRYRKHI